MTITVEQALLAIAIALLVNASALLDIARAIRERTPR